MPEVGTSRADIDAEQYALGAVLVSNGRVLDEDLGGILARDFYRPSHEALWERFVAMHAKGEPLEPVAVAASLDTDPIRGVDLGYLHTLVAACATPANASFYTARVIALAKLRRLALGAVAIMQTATETPAEEVDEAAAKSRAIVDDALTEVVTRAAKDVGTLVDDAAWRWGEPEVGLVPTGFSDLDDYLAGGLRPGHLMVIGARPAIGKSIVGTSILSHVAARGFGSIMFSLEMPASEQTDRIVSDVAGVDLTRLTRRNLGMEDWQRVSEVRGALSDFALEIDDRANVTLNMILTAVRDAKRRMKGNLRLVVVDYLQLVTPEDKRIPRHEQVATVSRGLKLLAREEELTVIAIAQVNRGSTMRADKRPTMSDLRESGAIEADADEIILLHRAEDIGTNVIEFILEKNRHGKTGVLEMAWLPMYARIGNLARHQ